MAPRRSGNGSSSKHRDKYIPASAQVRGDEHPSSIAMSSIIGCDIIENQAIILTQSGVTQAEAVKVH